MYRNCIFCSADFGTNGSLPTFPVGGKLAFDGTRGRLWAVCPRCARWNLSPIEERWEAVEDAERLFRDARLRVQSENVGVAQLPDGTRLVRVGQAVPGELAAWRYGSQLLRRRRRYLLIGGLGAVGIAAAGGLAAAGVGMTSLWMGSMIFDSRRKQRIIHRLGPEANADIEGRREGVRLTVRRWHLAGVGLDMDPGGSPVVVIRDAHRKEPGFRGDVDRTSKDVVVVRGDSARALLNRAMVHVNRSGATESTLSEANRLLGEAGSAERVLQQVAGEGTALGKRAGRDPHVLAGPLALAFEMALNEASERRALEGELAALEAAWREAEEIAAIADALPGSALINRLFDRLVDRSLK